MRRGDYEGEERQGRYYQDDIVDTPKNYSLLCASYLRKLLHRVTFLVVMIVLVIVVQLVAFLGGAVISEFMKSLGGV